MDSQDTQTTQTPGPSPTQRGPGTGTATMMVAGVNVEFPCKPYPSQMAMMSKVIQGLKNRKNCLLESPTGSGKSLALLCSALAWQRYEAERIHAYNKEIDDRALARLHEHEKMLEKMQKEEKVGKSRKEFDDWKVASLSKILNEEKKNLSHLPGNSFNCEENDALESSTKTKSDTPTKIESPNSAPSFQMSELSSAGVIPPTFDVSSDQDEEADKDDAGNETQKIDLDCSDDINDDTDMSEMDDDASDKIEEDDDDDDFKPMLKRTRISPPTPLKVTGGNLITTPSDSPLKNLAGTSKESILKNIMGDLSTDSPSKNGTPSMLQNSPANVVELTEKKLIVPKIYFGTRTHKQIKQIMRELRKTSYKNVRSVILASRDHTCINPKVETKPNKNELCRDLILYGAMKGGGCAFHSGARKLSNFAALSMAGLTPAADLEDLVTVGRSNKACPYFVSRNLMEAADIVFCPYNYLIDSMIRKSMNIDLKGHVVIFDEAHNMEDAARDAASLRIAQDDLQRTLQDCEKIAGIGKFEPYAHTQLAKLLSSISQWLDAQKLSDKTVGSSGRVWTGTDFLASLYTVGIDTDYVNSQMKNYQVIVAQRDKLIDESKEKGNTPDMDMLMSQSISMLESVMSLFNSLLIFNEGRSREEFRVALTQETRTQRKDGNSGSHRIVQVNTLHLWCLNPAIAFDEVRLMVHSIVLTSGTLSPMESFQSELGSPFPLTLEANHVIDNNQVWATAVGVGPNAVNLSGSYSNTSKFDYQDELGQLVLRVCSTVPHGILCFFPSYRLLDVVIERWTKSGLYFAIDEIKAVVVEPRSGHDAFREAMDLFYDSIRQAMAGTGPPAQTGAIFFAVCRGKVSEGLDFADEHARAVICVGIPFPNFKDMLIQEKKAFNDKHKARGLLSGSHWYDIQAFRAINQALGRCIRHRNDWGAILLVDDRFIKCPRYVGSLSKWIRSSVRTFPEWDNLEKGLQSFCKYFENR